MVICFERGRILLSIGVYIELLVDTDKGLDNGCKRDCDDKSAK